MKLTKGQRVRLTPKGINAHIKTGGSYRKFRPIKWETRFGIIDRIKSNGIEAHVIWDGTRYPADAISITALELVENIDDGHHHHRDINSNLYCDHCPCRNNDI